MKANPTRPVAALTALALLLALGGCDRTDLERTQARNATRKAVEATRTMGASASVELKDASARAAAVTEQAVDAAGEVATQVAGQLHVDDALIAAKVTTGLAADKNLSALKIRVEAHHGVVTLRGPAPSSAARARAEEIARNVQGVTSVDNQLAVQAG
ncbi:BON domain-containing protein [Caenimonas terrae]|uniref:BON domain-containing protein n=1 Tax=Caenimonas terrae TaxID=696074 RepID=A0ABW0NEG5_9BURK